MGASDFPHADHTLKYVHDLNELVNMFPEQHRRAFIGDNTRTLFGVKIRVSAEIINTPIGLWEKYVDLGGITRFASATSNTSSSSAGANRIVAGVLSMPS